MTLADTILKHGGELADFLLAEPGRPSRRGDAADGPAIVPVILADATAEYPLPESPMEEFEFRRDFPNLTPRFPRCFIEMARPSRLDPAAAGVDPSSHLPARWGWKVNSAGSRDLAAHLARGAGSGGRYRAIRDRLVASGLVDVDAVEHALDAADPYAAALGFDGPGEACVTAAGIARELDRLRPSVAAGRIAGRLGWLLHAQLVVADGARAVGPVVVVDIALDGRGQFLLPPLFDLHAGLEQCRVVAGDRELVLAMFLPVLWTLSQLNRAGVTLRPVEPIPGRARDAFPAVDAVTRPGRS